MFSFCQELPAFDAVPLADSEAFPSHVQEGQQTSSSITQSESMLSLDGVESAFEATEGRTIYNLTICLELKKSTLRLLHTTYIVRGTVFTKKQDPF